MLQIDIIIPVYNKEKYLTELLELLLSKEILYDKIIIVDDCSTDKSTEIIDYYANKYPKKIVGVYQKINKGPHYARLKGSQHSNKKYLMFVDADDLINLEGLENMLMANENWEKYGMCYGKTYKKYNLAKEYPVFTPKLKVKILNKPIDYILSVKPTMSGIIIRKDMVSLMKVGNCYWGEDIVFYTKVLLSSPVLYRDETIGIYRIIEGTRGNSGGTLRKRLDLIILIYTEIKNKMTITNICFFLLISSKIIAAWLVKQIK